GQAEALPFDDGVFDAVVSQFGWMFFEDHRTALREMLRVMLRVMRPSGYLVVAVWDSLDRTPGYAAMVALLHDLFGEEIARGLRAPFLLGDVEALRALCEEAGIENAQVTTHRGTVRFPSIEAWVRTEIKGWVLADVLFGAQLNLFEAEAERRLAPFCTPDGDVAFAAPAHKVCAIKV